VLLSVLRAASTTMPEKTRVMFALGSVSASPHHLEAIEDSEFIWCARPDIYGSMPSAGLSQSCTRSSDAPPSPSSRRRRPQR
jgi:hypothetical protein